MGAELLSDWAGVGQQESCQTGIGTGFAARKLATYIQVRKAGLPVLEHLVLVCLNSDWSPCRVQSVVSPGYCKGEA